MSIFLLLVVLAIGAALGWVFRDVGALVPMVRRLTRVSLWALLGAMGAKLAEQRAFLSGDLNIFFAAAGSSLALTLVFALVFWAAGFFVGNGVTESQAPGQPDANLVTDDKTGGAFKGLLSVAMNGGCILIGFLLFCLLPESCATGFPIDAFTGWLLRALLCFIGFDLGFELHRLDLRRLTPGLALAPFLNIALSLATGLLFGLLSGLGARDGALLTAGMGWYSLSSVLLAERGMMAISMLSFIHNVFRELLAILSAPLAARLSPLLPVYLGGATSMDVLLPFVQRYCGKEYTLVSFYSGVICSAAVMPLVKIIAG